METAIPSGHGAAIAFEGCGCRAAFHVGALEWFAANGVAFSACAGASSGALIAAAAALGRIDDLRPAWMTLLGTRVCEARRLLRGRWPFRMTEIVGGVARDYFGDRLIGDTRLPLAIVVTQLGARGFVRRTLTAADRLPIATAVLASCFIPGPYSRMVPIDRRPTFDGAWLGRVPIEEAHRLSAGPVVACVGDDEGRLLRGAVRPARLAPPRGIDVRVLSPIRPLPIGTFDFDRGATLECFEIGARSAEAFAARQRETTSRP